MMAMTNLVWVRLLDLPLHFWTLIFLITIGNLLGCFILVDDDKIVMGIVTFARICFEIYRSYGIPKNICIDWNGISFSHPIETKTPLFVAIPINKQVTFRKLALLSSLIFIPMV